MGSENPPTTGAAAGKTYAETRLTVLLKEYELIRAEQLLCIARVRYLAMFAIGIAGAALPAIATIIAAKDFGGADFVGEVIKQRSLLLQFIMVGVSLCAVALLQIYIGVFKQIFAFAEYFRVILIPDVNATLKQIGQSTSPNVFQWEVWLQRERSRSTLHKADSDLEAEPILISAVSMIYMSACIGVSWYSKSLFELSLLAFGALCLFIFFKYLGFRKVLKASTTD